jgi:acetyl-CoA C-acetyltransferase
MRSYVGGGTGVFAGAQGWYHVASGLFDTCLVVCEEKMSSYYPHAQAAFLTIFDHTTERPLLPNLLWIFALEMNRYMQTYGISKEDIARVSVQHKRNAAGHPCAMLAKADITLEDVLNSEVLAWPVQRLDVSPVSDGAVAIVLAAEHEAHHRQAGLDRGSWLEPGHRLLGQPRPGLPALC